MSQPVWTWLGLPRAHVASAEGASGVEPSAVGKPDLLKGATECAVRSVWTVVLGDYPDGSACFARLAMRPMLISLVMLIPDNLTTLITYCTVVESFFTTLSCSAVLWLRYKKPDLPRPIKVQLWMPSLFVIVSAILLVVPILSEPVAVVSGALMTLAGVPVYFAFVRTRPQIVRDLSTKFTHTCQKLFLSAVEEKED